MVPWQAKIRQGDKKIQMMVTTSTTTNNNNSETTTTSSSFDNSNGPDSPPVVFSGHDDIDIPIGMSQQKQKHSHYYEDTEERCRNCASTNLLTDWKQGDRVCTDCGVVAEEKLRDDRPEWKDFNDPEDLVKRGCGGSAVSNARSGLVPVDERKYIGGLQPTTLSKQPFGATTTNNGSSGYGLARIQRRLRATNRRLDLLMEKQHKRELKDAKIEREIRRKQQQQQQEKYPSALHDDDEDHYDDDEGLDQKHAALHNEKWSLDRAILLYGNDGDETSSSFVNNEEDREELKSRLDLTLQTASRDLYNAYVSTTAAMQELDLPHSVRQETLHRLVRYATRRDGLTVKGVSNRLSTSSQDKLRHSAAERKKLNERLKEYNKRKQSSALGAALIHLTAKSMGHPRAIAKICACFGPPPPESTTIQQGQQQNKVTTTTTFVKGKHCSKAIKEIKATFPEYVTDAAKAGANGLVSLSSFTKGGDIPETIWSSKATPSNKNNNGGRLEDDSHKNNNILLLVESVDNFAHHFVKNLQLPPVAEASIQTLLWQLRKEQIQKGNYSGMDMSTMCAGITYFVCTMGSILQKLAQQVQQQQEEEEEEKETTATAAAIVNAKEEKSNGKQKNKKKKRQRLQDSDTRETTAKRTKMTETPDGDSSSDDDNSLDAFNLDSLTGAKATKQDDDDDDEIPFDVFSHAPIVEDQSEKQRYEMRRMWDAWKEQMPWARSVIEIEQSCGVARNKITDFYNTELYPQRETLLQLLKECASSSSAAAEQEGSAGTKSITNSSRALQSTPMARTLLDVVSTAAALISLK